MFPYLISKSKQLFLQTFSAGILFPFLRKSTEIIGKVLAPQVQASEFDPWNPTKRSQCDRQPHKPTTGKVETEVALGSLASQRNLLDDFQVTHWETVSQKPEWLLPEKQN